MFRLTFTACFLFLTVSLFSQNIEVLNLRCNYKENPLSIESSPQLSWQLKSGQRNVLQTAYRILVSDDLKALDNNSGNIWDTKKVNSGTSIQIGRASCRERV